MNENLNINLREQLQGKNTIEAALFLSLEFVCRFGENWGIVSDLATHLLPKGRANSWAMLDRNINLFCKRFYGTWEQDEDKISFWDEVRFVLQTLPMKRDYKIDSEKQEEKYKLPNPESAAKYFVPCSLCWRSVYRLPLEKYTPLCHLHDIPSTFPEYRKRKRLKKHVEILKLKLIKSLPPLTDVKRKLGTEPSDYVKSLCLNSEYLPHLAKYLCSLSLPLNSNKEILEALEHPIYLNKIGAFKAQAWKYYLDDKAKHFLENYLKILAAEAWLRAEAEHKHGGKRR
ncbi:hypothetical protein LJC71_11500 [Desulfosarcina sp. OttesenSCG-928-A07]|nr:hypothetical protein [Desulfosarcina sp. OttesenSCG-928-G17]MDL2330343.1 hypothetical protein [Desulfosarcina sp. OttesenSCG-928-A07]